MQNIIKLLSAGLLTAALLGSAAAALAQPPTRAGTSVKSAQKDPAPKVQDCAIVAISSPSKYSCGGKVYTSFELAKLRSEAAKKSASGK